jgi:hypothetical protein
MPQRVRAPRAGEQLEFFFIQLRFRDVPAFAVCWKHPRAIGTMNRYRERTSTPRLQQFDKEFTERQIKRVRLSLGEVHATLFKVDLRPFQGLRLGTPTAREQKPDIEIAPNEVRNLLHASPPLG